MAILLGVDTGGTYTDAVLMRDEAQVIASSKALTTRSDLAIGVTEAVRAVLTQSSIAPGEIALASLSTTLATNALVEGQGGRVALIYIGFPTGDLERNGVAEAVNGDPLLVLSGGHSHAGSEAAPLDVAALDRFLADLEPVSGFAVASQFATRNPAHELEAARIITARTGVPVTCSHQLSARLNGPKRAVTAVLNARLIGMIDALIGRAQAGLIDLGIDAPLMVVRGDGALMSAEQARARPIETILSGPAASIVGARWLTGTEEALVSDIGGTTTDVALLRDGRPALDPDGARVGGFRTMVEAVAMRTSGLGGDSQVHPLREGLAGGVILGPRRVLPVALIAQETPDLVHATLDAQLRATAPGEYDASFVRAVSGQPSNGLNPRDALLLERIGTGLQPLGAVIRNRIDKSALRRLVDRGLVQLAGATPSDAAHVLGRVDVWDGAAAQKALTLIARKRSGSGQRLATDAAALANMIVDQMTEQTSLTLLESAFAEEVPGFDTSPSELVGNKLLHAGLNHHRGLLAFDTWLNIDVVGLGAAARCYYPAVGKRLGCRMVLPEHSDVANAIGAVVGRVTIRRIGTMTSPAAGQFRVHLESGPEDFTSPDEALDHLETLLRAQAKSEVMQAGAEGIQITVWREVNSAPVEAREIIVEAQITVEASGRPRIATH
ncbi:hydantoinase/oxoprolinase N-terminal domain-containing protein [Pontibaca salina]|uniref:Hydantoinase/oxoprolinase family protein n=1 Tax=Pontibaca salina TaxID=2795731 RepID=A0A934LZ69_9RHOB|nr:hydantoinase/oxoprolinase family protein [Pontibaca salina]MBI6630582.1 hydantoinase/oxoprolinase family protein [Pontibaca salina]